MLHSCAALQCCAIMHRCALMVAIWIVVGCSDKSPDQRIASPHLKQSEINPADVQSTDTTSEHDQLPVITRWVTVPDLPKDLAILDSVFWEPDDTLSLRELLRGSDLVKDKSVLEIGTGSGLVSLCCLQAGAASVVATDINPSAIRNANFNATEFQFSDRLECRLVPRRDPGAWTVVSENERFDVIISNPPWEDQKPTTVAEFALYDPEFALLKSLLQGARAHLKPKGKMLLAYGCVTAIRKIQEVAATENLDCKLLDDRSLDELPEVFLPGMLIEITIPSE